MRYFALVIALSAVACTQPVDSAPFITDTDIPELDAGGGDAMPTPDAGSTTDVQSLDSIDAGTDGRTDAAAEAATPDAVVAVDATDAGTVDVVIAPEAAAPDALPTVDARPAVDVVVVIDAGTTVDAAPSSDAGTTDAGGIVAVCDSPADGCQRAIATDAVVRSTFPMPCDMLGQRMCGGVNRGVVETLPIVCWSGNWRLDGYWSGAQWVPGHSCSMGCGAAGKLCNP